MQHLHVSSSLHCGYAPFTAVKFAGQSIIHFPPTARQPSSVYAYTHA